jgi:hypothetical protein
VRTHAARATRTRLDAALHALQHCRLAARDASSAAVCRELQQPRIPTGTHARCQLIRQPQPLRLQRPAARVQRDGRRHAPRPRRHRGAQSLEGARVRCCATRRAPRTQRAQQRLVRRGARGVEVRHARREAGAGAAHRSNGGGSRC